MYRYKSVWYSDDFSVRSEDEKQNSAESSDNDRDFGSLGERCRRPKTSRRFVTTDFVDLLNVSSYSPGSETTNGCAMSDTTPESADDTDSGCGVPVGIGEISQADLRLRVRRSDEENSLLREDLATAEELAAGLQRQLENLQQKLDDKKEKYRQLEHENDRYQELLQKAEQKERDCRWALQKLDKEKSLLATKIDDAEAKKQQITLLNSKLERCKKEKYDCIREATLCKRELEDKQRECELLKEQLAQMIEVNKNLQESYDKTIQCLRDNVQELKDQKFGLRETESIGSSSDDFLSTSPSGHFQSYTHSTSYSNSGLQDSLYDELKASVSITSIGFSAANESRVRELEDELSWYGEEIHRAVDQINDVTQRLCHKRSIPHVPDLNLNDIGDTKIPEISLFLRKITELSNMVNEIIRRPKVKDACSQLRVDANHTNELLSSEFGIRSFEDQLRFVKEKTELETNKRENSNFERETDVFVNAFSMNTRLLGESSENKIEISTEQSVDSRDNDNFSTTSRDSMSTDVETHEHPIIDPIVQEIERILQCTNKSEEEPTVNSPILKNPRYRCIYTTVDNSATDSTLNSPKRLQRDLASTYILSSGGDGLSLPTINNTNITTNTTEQMIVTILSDDSEKTEADSLTESMLKSRTLETTKIIDDQTIPEEIIDHELNIIVDEKSNSENFNSPPTSPRIIQHLSSTPRRNNANFAAKKAQPTNGEKSVAPSECLRNLPKRKISVFHRSFDIDTVHDETEQQQQQQQQTGSGIISSSETYRLTERSMSSPDERENCSIDTMELDPECMKMSLNTRKFLLNYRDKNEESDSSDASSPLKSMDNREKLDKPEVAIINRPRPLILAPTKLNLGSIAKIPPYVGSEKNPVKINDEDSGKIVNQTRLRETKNLAANEKELRNEEIRENCEKRENNENSNEKETTEIIRPGDEIERGVTCRKTSFSRELNISDYSLISQMEQDTRVNDQVLNEKTDCMTRVIFQSDSSESTSCESSPKRENLRFQANSKPPLLSTYEIPRTRERNYARQDPSMPRGTWYDSVEEAVRGYQTKNEIVPTATTTSVGNYDGVITGTIIRDGQQKQDVKAKSVKIPAVALAMSSGEDSSDSECDPMAIRENDNINSRCNVVNETRSISPTVLNFVDGALLGTSTPAPTNNNNNKNQKNNNNDNVKKPKDIEDCETKKAMDQKREKRERPHTIRRSLSENGCGLSESRCRLTNASTSQDEFNKEETRPNVFPSLTDVRLQESGIAKLPSNDEIGGNLPEADLERKYMALSVGLVTDRVTLPRRVALSIRQRDQSERNLSCEVQKMHQDIQDLAPLCIDRESVERVERVRHQLEMITQCAHRVSCTAETLGAVHQENRISRAILLADRYLLVLRSRCEKLALDLTETKRILTENNIVIEEHNGEFGDDMPRTRYRGVPITNRTMMARRRASIATIFRPLGNFQDVTKDGLRQRNSVSGRVTLRRPSLSAESQKWEAEKLDRTDSSSSIGELREIFEQAESRRNSREENNNNVLRLHSSNLSIRDCDNGDIDVWTNAREEPVTELSVFVDGGCHESRNGRRTPLPQWMTNNNAPWKTMLWCIIISFFFGFYVKHAVSSTSECTGTHLKWWSIEEILERYLQIKKDLPRPI